MSLTHHGLSRAGSGRIYGSDLDSPKMSRTSSGRIPGAEFEQKEPGVVDFRSILKSREPDEGATDRRSMPPSFKHEEPSGSTDIINNIATVERKSWLDEKNERFKIRAESEPKNVPPRGDEGDIGLARPNEEKVTAVKQSKVAAAKKPSEEKVDFEKDFDDLIDLKMDTEKDFDDLVDFNEEPLPPSATSRAAAPLAVEDSASASESETTSSGSSDSAEETGENSKETEESVEINGTRESSEESDESVDDVDDTNYETCESLNETQETQESEEEESEESEEEDVGESYDSEFDGENDHLYSQGRTLSTQIPHYKKRVSAHDSPGQVYIFSDSPVNSPLPRFKIKASRFPKRRLAQARCFNINMKMLASFRVSLRRRVMTKIIEKLEMYAVAGREGWYQGPTDDVRRVVQTMVDRYPDTTSEC